MAPAIPGLEARKLQGRKWLTWFGAMAALFSAAVASLIRYADQISVMEAAVQPASMTFLVFMGSLVSACIGSMWFFIRALKSSTDDLSKMSPFKITDENPAGEEIVEYLESNFDSNKGTSADSPKKSRRSRKGSSMMQNEARRRTTSAPVAATRSVERKKTVVDLIELDLLRDRDRKMQRRAKRGATTGHIQFNFELRQRLGSEAEEQEEDTDSSSQEEASGQDEDKDKDREGSEEAPRSRRPSSCRSESSRKMSRSFVIPTQQELHDTTSQLQDLANKLPQWDFDMFEVQDVSHTPLVFIGFICLDTHLNLPDCTIDKPKLLNFLHDVEGSYRKVPYHNSLHGASVARSMYSFCMNGLAFSREYMELALILAGLTHDVHHPGVTPGFLSKAFEQNADSNSLVAPLEGADLELACKYNDTSILENMHCAVTFDLLRREGNQFLSPDVTSKIRKPLIRAILGTDMAKHAETMTRLVALTENMKQHETRGTPSWYWPATPPANCDEKQRMEWEFCMQEEFVMEVFLHAADIGNPTLPMDQWKRWNCYVNTEFQAQGDMERELFGCLISPPAGFDRNASAAAVHNFTKGFMLYLVQPFWEQLGELTRVRAEHCVARGVDLSICLGNLHENLELWDQNIPVEDQEEDKLQ
ncbi:unnamed protein product [Polarella glacialis]|uniref:PDEase domain-containing protein n=1 Tax=Polarella glacialis TaxID=89957 RepID=A0A813FXL1_POLGL|nr:unnamed protein product [Polarella glacialis]